MGLRRAKVADNWQKTVAMSLFAGEVKDYLSRCEIKRIEVSQAENAWDIYFRCPDEPEERIIECIKEIWIDLFGEQFKPAFHFEVEKIYTDAASLCADCWEELKERISLLYPSCRVWLEDAGCQAGEDWLRLSVKQEAGWSYLTAHGLKEKMEALLRDEYRLAARVELVMDEQGDETPEDPCLQDDLAERYREVFRDTLKKAAGQKKEKKGLLKVIMGKKISGEITPLNKIVEEESNVIVSAFIFNLAIKTLKTGRTLITFCVSDKTDSLAAKVIVESKTAPEIFAQLHENEWYLLRGMVQTDKYTQDLTLFPRDIMETKVESRRDECPEKRVELHLHTKMSAMDGIASAAEVIKRASLWGHQAVAITDHGVVQSFPEAYEAAQKQQVHLIYGLEAYIFDDRDKQVLPAKTPTYHCIILAKNQEGLRNLYELVTRSHLTYYYRVPRIPKSELQELREGLLIGSACEAGELIQAYLRGAQEDELAEIAGFYDYLEIQPRGNNYFLLERGSFQTEKDLLKINRTIYELGKKLNKPVVATGDVHFLDPEDEVYRRVLMAGKGFEDADRQAPLYLKTTAEMLEEFAYLGEEAAFEVVVKNTQEVAGMTEEVKPIPDEFFPPEIAGAEDEIKNLAISRAFALYGEPLPEIVHSRLEKELNAIINNGFAVLYLIAHKLVKKSNEDGYLVGSRGSVGSSLVATFCGITEVNPLPPHYRCPSCKYSRFLETVAGSGSDLPDELCPNCQMPLVKDGHNIRFEVFMGFEGDKVPDIDLNFSGDYQAQAHKYTEKLFGKENVFRAGTIATIASKTAYGFVKSYFEERKQVLRSPETNRLVLGCTGVKRTTGQHPGGVMVLPKGLDVHRFTPLQRPADDTKSETITTHFDYHAISSRLVKLDLLGHDDPTVLKMLEDLTGVDCRTIPLDEPKVLSLFRGTEALGIDEKELGTAMGTLGIPEFGTKFVRQMLEDTKPKNFSDLVRISGFSHGTDVWLNNAQDLIRNGVISVSEAISARDDIMIYLMQKGVDSRLAFHIMEDVRKGRGVRADYVEKMKEQGVPEWYIDSCQKIKYLFPKAHAVAYVMMAFRIAYFKVYYPAAFYASFFTVRADEFDADLVVGGIPSIRAKMEQIAKKGSEATQKEEKLFTILELAHEMYLRGISMQRVDLLKSDWRKFQVIQDGCSLLPPFVSLQGLGQTAAQGIVKARKNRYFTSQEDLRSRAKLSKPVLDVLANHGCLRDLPENDQITLF